MLPVIVLVGRPNVGKSTLFNRLTKSRNALVYNVPGVTRDRLYGEAEYNGMPYILVDTGGLCDDANELSQHMTEQVDYAIEEATIVFFIVDARDGLTPSDEAIAKKLRQRGKQIHLIVNKIDGLDHDAVMSDFHRLGFSSVFPISASHGRGVQILFDSLPLDTKKTEEEIKPEGAKVAVIGRPNVGKSTLINRILGENRQVVSDIAGTTRDSIYIPFLRHDKQYMLIDTAGVRRRARVSETLEKFSVIKSLRAIEDADVVLLLIDAQEGLVTQDLGLLGFAMDAGKGLIIAVNKWDHLSDDQRYKVRYELDRRLGFAEYALVHYISALHGTGVGDLFKSVDKVYRSATKIMTTSTLTKILEQAVSEHQPPMKNRRRIKLRYAHAGGHKPPLIVIHGTQAEQLPKAYQRFLMNYFRKTLKLIGTPVRLTFKSSENPYKDKKNPLTPRQFEQRKRMIQHRKGQ